MADEDKETTLEESTRETEDAAEVAASSPAEAATEADASLQEDAEVELTEPDETGQDLAEQDAGVDAHTEVFGSEVVAVNDDELDSTNLNLLMDVSLLISVELGRKEMRFNDILQLSKGSLVELNKVADEPVDIYVNQSKVAEGEVVVVDDHFGVRITRLLNSERLKRSG
jgi:flagellar motor switch protein FliN/FliY